MGCLDFEGAPKERSLKVIKFNLQIETRTPEEQKLIEDTGYGLYDQFASFIDDFMEYHSGVEYSIDMDQDHMGD